MHVQEFTVTSILFTCNRAGNVVDCKLKTHGEGTFSLLPSERENITVKPHLHLRIEEMIKIQTTKCKTILGGIYQRLKCPSIDLLQVFR